MINSEINDQQAMLDANLSFPNVDRKKTPILKGTQKQWMVGLDYAMEEHAWLAVNVGQIMVSNKYSLALGGAALGTYKVGEDGNYSYTESKDKSMNMPAYYYVEADANPATFTHEFTQMIFEASINVEF